MPTNYDRVSLETTGAFTVPISYSTLSLFDNIAHVDQVEVYRTNITSIYNNEFTPDTLSLSAADLGRFGIIKPEWITYNETTKQITAISIPVAQTFTSSSGTVITYPQMIAGEPLEIRRRTISSDVLVEWVTGGRITAEQLNLLGSQLLGLSQENLYDLENKVLKSDDADITYATPEYVDASFNSLADLITLPGGIENANDRDKCLVVLSRISSQNIPQAAASLKWDALTSKLQLVGQATQSQNRLEFLASDGTTVLNYVNPRGVLNSAGRIYYGNTTPSPAPNAADTGVLWWDTTGGSQVLKVWNGTSWDFLTVGAGSYVTVDTTQTVTGAKTFSAATTISGQLNLTTSNLVLSNTVDIRGSGVSKGLDFKPTNASSTPVTVLSLTASATTIPSGINLDYFSLGTNAKALTCTLSDAQTITGVKTINTHVVLGPSSTYSNQATITTTTSTSGGSNLVFRINGHSNTRYIRIYNETDATNGIQLKARNQTATGNIYLDGDTYQNTGDFYLASTNKIRNLKNCRIPGSFTTFRRNGNTLAAGSLSRGEGLDDIPECTISASQAGTAPYAVTITINNTGSVEQKYKITFEQMALSTYPQASAVLNHYDPPVAADTITIAGGGSATWVVTTSHAGLYNATNASHKFTVTVVY